MMQKKITVMDGFLTESMINFLNARGIIVSDLDEPKDHILIEDEVPFSSDEKPEDLDVTEEFARVKEKISEMYILCEGIDERVEGEDDYDPSDDLDILEFHGDTLEDLMMDLWVAKEGYRGHDAAEGRAKEDADKLAHEMLEMRTRRNVTDLQEIVACQGETLEVQEDEICRLCEKTSTLQDKLVNIRDEVRRHIDNHVTNETEKSVRERVTDAILSFNKKYESLWNKIVGVDDAAKTEISNFSRDLTAIRKRITDLEEKVKDHLE